MNNELDFRFKAYQFKSTDGWTWMIEYPDIPGCVGGGDSLEEAIKEGKENIKAYFEVLKQEGKTIPTPTIEPKVDDYSGKLVLRLSKSNHKKLAEVAQKEGISINFLLNEMVTEGLSNRLNVKASQELIDGLKQDMLKANNLAFTMK